MVYTLLVTEDAVNVLNGNGVGNHDRDGASDAMRGPRGSKKTDSSQQGERADTCHQAWGIG
ncbi:MAG: hypothetical protein ACRYFS_07555 [Janthinobacterium lividum]